MFSQTGYSSTSDFWWAPALSASPPASYLPPLSSPNKIQSKSKSYLEITPPLTTSNQSLFHLSPPLSLSWHLLPLSLLHPSPPPARHRHLPVHCAPPPPQRPAATGFPRPLKRTPSSRLVTVSAVGDVSADGTTYLIGGAIAVALLGTAFPIIFSRRDTCPECDGAGFVRKAGAALRANAARKDQAQIVCPRCNGLGKLGQIDK